MVGGWGVRLRWVPANVGLGILTNLRDPVLAIIVGPFALFMGKNP